MGNYPEDDQLTSSELRPEHGSGAGVAVASPPSSLVGEGARFVPGTIIAERYRMIAQIGRGGMGEVYRADDLRLGQSVALKFLPESLTRDPGSLARLTREVRTARQVSHPNVCRVFDIGEADGVPFITMEFVDGEDLASLLRRIGRLQEAKALQLAHQLCAGLAEIHAFGILHRDLKPANIMLDGRGNLRITDFGLAVVAQEIPGNEVAAGTPAYMAPEQLAGEKPTHQSDIYALGLILFELFTGKPAFEKLRTHTSTSLKPSTVAKDVDGVIERAILRCLEKEPAARPRTATIVASALPGGDPLAAAIAAGETPSPDVVAAAVDEQPISMPLAWIMIGVFVCALIGTAAFARYGSVDGLMPLEKPSEIVADRAREVLKQLGYTLPAADSVYWVSDDYRQLEYLANHEDSREWRRKLAELYPSPTRIFYRQSPQPLDAELGLVSIGSPSHELSGMAMVELDQRGRLRLLRVVPQRYDETAESTAQPDWKALFGAAELPEASFTPVATKWQSPVAYDARAAWEGSYGGHALHVTAAALHGRPVYFEVLGPWDTDKKSYLSLMPYDLPPALLTFLFSFGIPGLLWIGGIVLARRNWRTGRGDRAGAVRVAIVTFAAMWLSFLLRTHHAVDPNEFSRLVRAIGVPAHMAALCGVLYLGLEPLARRRWPGYLVSWARVLAGRFNNPRVGRDLLVGAALGTFDVLIETGAHALPYWFNISKENLLAYGLEFDEVVRYVGDLMTASVIGIIAGITILGFLVIVTLMLRNERLVFGVTFLLMLGLHASGDGNLWIGLAIGAIHAGIVFFLLLRFGLLAVVASFICTWVLETPLTLDMSRWYFGRSMLVVGLTTAIAIYGFRTALAGRPMFGGELGEN